MLTQTYYGKPKCCYNRKCKHPFDKDSHKGWMQKGVTEVYAVMKCHKCKGPITLAEQRRMRKRLEGDSPLTSLTQIGLKPGED
jgi:hypothetical protein